MKRIQLLLVVVFALCASLVQAQDLRFVPQFTLLNQEREAMNIQLVPDVMITSSVLGNQTWNTRPFLIQGEGLKAQIAILGTWQNRAPQGAKLRFVEKYRNGKSIELRGTKAADMNRYDFDLSAADLDWGTEYDLFFQIEKAEVARDRSSTTIPLINWKITWSASSQRQDLAMVSTVRALEYRGPQTGPALAYFVRAERVGARDGRLQWIEEVDGALYAPPAAQDPQLQPQGQGGALVIPQGQADQLRAGMGVGTPTLRSLCLVQTGKNGAGVEYYVFRLAEQDPTIKLEFLLPSGQKIVKSPFKKTDGTWETTFHVKVSERATVTLQRGSERVVLVKDGVVVSEPQGGNQ